MDTCMYTHTPYHTLVYNNPNNFMIQVKWPSLFLSNHTSKIVKLTSKTTTWIQKATEPVFSINVAVDKRLKSNLL